MTAILAALTVAACIFVPMAGVLAFNRWRMWKDHGRMAAEVRGRR